MPRVRFDNGQEVEFDSIPSHQDIEDVASKLGISTKTQTSNGSIFGGAKALIGGIASGIGGIGLTLEETAFKKAVEMLPDNFSIAGINKQQMLTNLQKSPSLQEQFKSEMGGEKYPKLYGTGQLAGEVATLATPVGAVGTATKAGLKALNVGEKIATLGKAGAEGLAFTAGQSLTEGKSQSLSDYAINTGLNIAFPGAGMIATSLAEKLPARIVNSLIKPLAKDFAYGKNPGKTISERGIVANNFDELINKIDTETNTVGGEIGSYLDKSTVKPILDTDLALKPIDDAINNALLTPRTNAEVLNRLDSVKQDLVDNINRGIETNELKKLVGDLTKWTGNASDDKLVNKTLKQVYGAVNEQVDFALKQGLSPEDFAKYKKANEQYGDLISAKNASVYRDKILERQDLISFGAKNAGLITALASSIAQGGIGIETILAGLGGVVIDKAMATPAFKTRLAKLLVKLQPNEIKTFFDKVPTAKILFTDKDIDNLVNKIESLPNKQGGFVKNPLEKSNSTIGSKVDDVLLQEAKKYPTPEEFVKAQGTPVYHGTNAKFDTFDKTKIGEVTGRGDWGDGFYFSDSKDVARSFAKDAGGDIVMEVNLKNLKFADGNKLENMPEIQNILDDGMGFTDMGEYLKSKGYDGVKYKHKGGGGVEYVVYDPSKIKTKSQLIDIWKKANKK